MLARLRSWRRIAWEKIKRPRWWLSGLGVIGLALLRAAVEDWALERIGAWGPAARKIGEFVLTTFLAPTAIIVGFVLILLAHAYIDTRRREDRTVTASATPDTLDMSATRPSPVQREIISDEQRRLNRKTVLDALEKGEALDIPILRAAAAYDSLVGGGGVSGKVRRWIRETYYTLRDETSGLEAVFGHPDSDNDLGRRLELLRMMLDDLS